MKLIKILLIIIVAVILLIISVISLFAVTFDANQYKQELSVVVKEKTGRSLEFKGDLGLTLYPSLGMKLGSMSFSNAPGFGDKPMLKVNNASVSVDVMSLISLEPKIAELILDGLDVNLQKNKQGKTNWDDLVTEIDQSSDAASAGGDDVHVVIEADEEDAFKAAFDGLAITNVSLLWSDEMAGAQYKVNVESLLTGKIAENQSFPLFLKMALQSVNEVSSDLTLKTDVLFNKNKITMSSLQVDATAQGALIPVDQLILKLQGDVSFHQLSKQLSVKGFNTAIKSTGGVLDSSDTTIAGEIGFDLKQQQLTIAVLDIQSKLSGSAVPNKAMKAAVSASKLDLQLDKRSIKLEDLVLALNENTFKGFLNVFDYAKPDVEFELKSEKFDVDSLLGAKKETEEEPIVAADTAPKDVEIALPMDLLRSLKLDGKLEVTTLLAQGLTVNNFLLNMYANKGLVSIEPLTMDLYDGTFDGAIKINAQGDKPVYTVRKKISSFQIGHFLQDFMNDDFLSGNANVKIDLKTRGDWLSQLKTNLNGDLSIAVKDGALKGYNLRHSIETARAKLKGEKEPELVEKKTDFSALSISGLVKDGIFSTDDLDLQAPLIRVGGKGSVDIAKETVDYLVNAKVVTTIKGQDAGTVDDLSGLFIPVAITGPWLSPDIDVQYDELLKEKLNAEKEKASAALAKQKAELQEKLAAEKAKLKAAKEKELAAQKLKLEKQRELAEAEQKAKLEEEKKKKQAELDAKKKAAEEKAKKTLEDKLKKLF